MTLINLKKICQHGGEFVFLTLKMQSGVDRRYFIGNSIILSGLFEPGLQYNDYRELSSPSTLQFFLFLIFFFLIKLHVMIGGFAYFFFFPFIRVSQ